MAECATLLHSLLLPRSGAGGALAPAPQREDQEEVGVEAAQPPQMAQMPLQAWAGSLRAQGEPQGTVATVVILVAVAVARAPAWPGYQVAAAGLDWFG